MKTSALSISVASALALSACAAPPPPQSLGEPTFNALTLSANNYRTTVETKADQTRVGRYATSMVADAALAAAGVGAAYNASSKVLGTLGTVAVASGGSSSFLFPTSYDPIYQAAILGADCVAIKGEDLAIKVRAIDSTLATIDELPKKALSDADIEKLAKARQNARDAKNAALDATPKLHGELMNVHRQTFEALDKAKPTLEQLAQFFFTNFVAPDKTATAVHGTPAGVKSLSESALMQAVDELNARVEALKLATAAAQEATCRVTAEGAPLTIHPSSGITLRAGQTQTISVTGGEPPYECKLEPTPGKVDDNQPKFTLVPSAENTWAVGLEAGATKWVGSAKCLDKKRSSATLYIRVAD